MLKIYIEVLLLHNPGELVVHRDLFSMLMLHDYRLSETKEIVRDSFSSKLFMYKQPLFGNTSFVSSV